MWRTIFPSGRGRVPSSISCAILTSLKDNFAPTRVVSVPAHDQSGDPIEGNRIYLRYEVVRSDLGLDCTRPIGPRDRRNDHPGGLYQLEERRVGAAPHSIQDYACFFRKP